MGKEKKYHIGQNGLPRPKFAVSEGDVPDDVWGEGYVVSTVKPFYVARWGFCSHIEGQTMSACMPGDGDVALGVLCDESDANRNDIDEILTFHCEALGHVLDMVTARSDSDQPKYVSY